MLENEKASKNKVGIITLYHGNYNFGGILQAYALPTALKKYLGISAEQVDYISLFENEKEIKEKLTIGKFIYKCGVHFFNTIEKSNFKRRKKVFDRFM